MLLILSVNTIDLGLPHSLIHIFRLMQCHHHSSIPFTKLLSSDTRKRTVLVISSGVPAHPSWMVTAWLSTNSCACSLLNPKRVYPGVGTTPGLIALTRILRSLRPSIQLWALRSHGSLGRAIKAKGWGAYARSSRGVQNNRSALWQQR